MIPVDNHYEFLGLEPSASHESIETAIERVSEQAVALVYSSPQRSADLWERIRQMRRDLLASAEGRQVYDEALLRREKMVERARAEPAITDSTLRSTAEAQSIYVPVPVAAPPAKLIAFSPMPEEDQPRAVAWPYALVAAAAVFVVVVGSLLARGPGSSPVRRPVAMTLSQLGARNSSKFVSGGLVTLRWTRVPHASRYRVQIATAPGDPSDAVVFAHGSSIVTVQTTRYLLKVKGPQVYYWRVQAVVGGRAQEYTPSVHFAVDRPRTARPVALAPVTGIGKGGKHARLCWSPVQGAVGYRLRVQGQATRTVHGTCITLSVRPSSYRWSVAALVQGVGVYTGSFSVAAVLHIHPAHHATRLAYSRHRSTRHVSMKHTRIHGVIAAATRHKTSRPVEVAFAVPPTSTPSASRRAVQSLRTTTRIVSTKLRRAVHALGRITRTSSRVHRTVTSAASHHIAGVTAGSTAAHAAATPVSRRHVTGSPTHPPNPPSTPSTRSTSVVASRIPAPPPPPPVPTTGAAATVPTTARQVTTAGTATSASPIYVRPIVAPQIATTTPNYGNTPAATTTSQTVHVSSPAPTATKATAPTPIPAREHPTPQSHPIHPSHPDHPAHPTHPGHP